MGGWGVPLFSIKSGTPQSCAPPLPALPHRRPAPKLEEGRPAEGQPGRQLDRSQTNDCRRQAVILFVKT